jgi:pimeloyl-ACP methyl ester carboxylesterase
VPEGAGLLVAFFGYGGAVTETSFTAGPIAGWETGDGPAVLFLHGGPGMNDYGRMLAPELAGWRFLSFQQRGLSPSATEGPFTLEQHVADATAVLDARGVRRAIVVGHSFGGHLALHLAVLRPDRVAALVLVDGLGVIGDGGIADVGAALAARLRPEAAERLQQIAAELGDAEPDDELASEQLRLVWPGYFADPATAPAPPGELRVGVDAHQGTFASVTEQLAAGFASRLAGISVPVVSVLGELSPMPVSQGEQTAALISGAEVRVIEGAGHLPWHERPGCVAEALGSVQDRIASADVAAG